MLSHWSGPCDKCRRTHLRNRKKGSIDLQQTSPTQLVCWGYGAFWVSLENHVVTLHGCDWREWLVIVLFHLGTAGKFLSFLIYCVAGQKAGGVVEPHANDQPYRRERSEAGSISLDVKVSTIGPTYQIRATSRLDSFHPYCAEFCKPTANWKQKHGAPMSLMGFFPFLALVPATTLEVYIFLVIRHLQHLDRNFRRTCRRSFDAGPRTADPDWEKDILRGVLGDAWW